MTITLPQPAADAKPILKPKPPSTKAALPGSGASAKLKSKVSPVRRAAHEALRGVIGQGMGAGASALQAARAAKTSFRDKQFALRETAIIDAVNHQLTTRGFEAMVLDDIAAEVGIAKGSLYKHFASKEALACAALKQLLLRLQAQAAMFADGSSALDQLKNLLRWALQERCASRLPMLPSTNESLRQTLLADKSYVQALSDVTDTFGLLIEQAVAAKQLRGDIEPMVMMFSIYSRSCDPTFDFLRATQAMSDEAVVEALLKVAFGGLES